MLSRNFALVKKDPVVELAEGNYTVQQGDTLYSLARKFNRSVADLKRINNLSDNALSIGQKIRTK